MSTQSTSERKPLFGRLDDPHFYKDKPFKRTFSAIDPSLAKTLTPDEVIHYNVNGYVVSREPVVSQQDRDLLLERASQTDGFPAGDSSGPPITHLLDSLVHGLVTAPKTAAILQDLLGEDVVCYLSAFINREPGSPDLGGFHQDAVFNPMDVGSIIVWVPLKDADSENGCMRFVPASHLWGPQKCDPGTFRLVDSEQFGNGIPCEVKAGHAVFMHDLLLHSSPANRSKDRDRPAITATYASAQRKPAPRFEQSSTLVAGSDVMGYWNPQEPFHRS